MQATQFKHRKTQILYLQLRRERRNVHSRLLDALHELQKLLKLRFFIHDLVERFSPLMRFFVYQLVKLYFHDFFYIFN